MEPQQIGNIVVTARPAADADRAFLCAVYGSTRAEQLAQLPWTAAQMQAFIEHQFLAQDHYYRSNYPGAEFLVLVADGRDAGRLYVHQRETEIRVMDIAILPEFRHRGIGTAALRWVLAAAAAGRKRVSIHVELFNPGARRLYERLGFREAGRNETDALMEWTPGQG